MLGGKKERKWEKQDECRCKTKRWEEEECWVWKAAQLSSLVYDGDEHECDAAMRKLNYDVFG